MSGTLGLGVADPASGGWVAQEPSSVSPSDTALLLVSALIAQCTISTLAGGSLALITARMGLAQASRRCIFLTMEKAGLSTSMTLHLPTLHTSTPTLTSLMTRHHPMRPPSTPTACSTTLQMTMPLRQWRPARRAQGMVVVKVPRPGAWNSLCPPQGPLWQTWKTQATAAVPCSCPPTPPRVGAPQPQSPCQGVATTAAVPSIPWCRGQPGPWP